MLCAGVTGKNIVSKSGKISVFFFLLCSLAVRKIFVLFQCMYCWKEKGFPKWFVIELELKLLKLFAAVSGQH